MKDTMHMIAQRERQSWNSSHTAGDFAMQGGHTLGKAGMDVVPRSSRHERYGIYAR